MYQEPEHNDYDDDDYNYYPEYSGDEYSEYTKKFNIDWAAWEQWLSKAIKEIVEEDNNVWIIGGHQSKNKNNTYKNKSKISDSYFMYLGNNQYEEAIWKQKYFAKNQIEQVYMNHISSNAAHFLLQPAYYKGLFDILN
jgi:hypothetical protein